jgi:hypothetical protein
MENKQTAMQKLLLQLKEERRNIPMDIEWDRCYQAIEMVIQNTYLPIEKEQIINSHLLGLIHPLEIEATKQAEQYYNETYGGIRT